MTLAPVTLAPSPASLLRWYIEAGADEAIGEVAVNRFAPPPPRLVAPVREPSPVPAPAHSPPQPSPAPVVCATAAHVAAQCRSLDELRQALLAFEGIAWKAFAHNLVFGDGNPEAEVMVIGEAPGPEEDVAGLPFVGPSGKLLGKMLASIGLDRTSAYITNIVPWKPPASIRKPGPDEVAVCLPFITRHIELVDPKVLVLFGGVAASALLARHEGITRIRGRWYDYHSPGLPRPLPALATYHPAYLLRTPEAKREAWHDLLSLRKRLDAGTA